MTTEQGSRRVLATITARRRLSDQVILLTLAVRGPYRWQAGQHLALSDSADGAELSYYSIASAPDPERHDELELAVGEAGFKYSSEVGTELYLEAAAGGVDWSELSEPTHWVLVGMGTGIAPLRAVVQRLASQPAKNAPITVVQGSRTAAGCLFFDEFRGWEERGVEYIPVLSREEGKWHGRSGRVQQVVGELPVRGAHYFVCGSREMVDEVSETLRQRGLPETALFAEGY